MQVELQSNGFRIKEQDYLILIKSLGRDRWSYEFYKSNPESEDNSKVIAAHAPFECNGAPWITSRYRDTLFVNALRKILLSEKEETQNLVRDITMELYNYSEEYSNMIQSRSGYDYHETICGIPKTNIAWRLHPAMDYYDKKLYIGYRFTDDSMSKKEWVFDSKLNIKSPEQLQQERIILKEKDIIGDQRWKDISNKDGTQLNPYKLFSTIRQKLTHYIYFNDQVSYDIIALWIMGTYMYWAFDSYPYIHLSGTPDSGKSRVQRLSSCLTFNGYFTESISTSSIFRYVEDMRATLHIDEQEFLSSENNLETISILNSGYHKAGNATRQEPYSDKDGNRRFRTVSFSTYSPKMLSGIRGLDKTLQTRSIHIPMKPTMDPRYSRKEVNQDELEWQSIRDSLYMWALHSFEDVMICYEEVKDQPIEIKNRMWQKYHVLLALSYHLKKIYTTSTIYDSIIKFIQEDQIKNIEFEDFKIDLTYKVLYRLLTKAPHPKGYYALKTIRNECGYALGMQEPFDFEQPHLLFIKNIHTTLNQLGFKTFPLTGNFRGIKVTLPQLEADASARGIALNTPIITM